MGGPNTDEVQALIDKARARMVRATMEVLESTAFPSMTDADVTRVRRVLRMEINQFTGSVRNLLDQVVDETVAMNAEALRMLAERG